MTLPLLRAATEGDLAALAALEVEVFGADAWSAAATADELSRADRQVIVSGDGSGQVSGYVVMRSAGDILDLMRIAVRPDHRRRGLGGLLLHAAIDGAASFPDAERILLEVASTNAAAIALYESHGFAVIDRRRGYYRDGVDALIMQLMLAGPPNR